MSFIDNMYSSKTDYDSEHNKQLLTREVGFQSEAEQIASTVFAGLKSENYAILNQELEGLASPDESRIGYVFEHPSAVSEFASVIACIVVMLGFAYFLFISITTFIFSAEHLAIGIIGTIVSLVFLSANILIIARNVKMIKRKNRFDIIYEVLRLKSLVFIDDIAMYAKQKKSIIVNDLLWAVNTKLVPQGHFSRKNLVFMVSDNIYDKYTEKSAVYDRFFREKIRERHRVQTRSEKINQIMGSGEQYAKKLNDYRTLIKDKFIAKEIERLETIVSMIFHEVDVNPSQADSLGVFLNYYLPTTEKLIDAYVSISNSKANMPGFTTTKAEIETALKKATASFENILEKLYAEYEMGITSEIAAMEMVMSINGLPN